MASRFKDPALILYEYLFFYYCSKNTTLNYLFFQSRMENLGDAGGGGSDNEEHMGETVCICGKV